MQLEGRVWINTGIVMICAAVTTWWAQTKLQYSRLTVSIVKEPVSPNGQALETALNNQISEKIKPALAEMQHNMMADLAFYSQYYQQFSMVLAHQAQERQAC